MPNASGRTTSSWMGTVDVPEFAPLGEDTRAEVCVVGAGIAGLSVAYELTLRGRSVIVLDDNAIGGGETGRTTAHLSDALDKHYRVLEDVHGTEGARLAFESHRAAIERIEAIVRDEQIDCDFERLDGYLFVPPGQSHKEIDLELQACHRVGKTDVSIVDRAPIPGIDTGRCLRHPGQGQFHVLKYLNGLAAAIVRRGGRICCGSHVATIAGGKPCRVSIQDGPTVEADAVVVATNSPINDRVQIHTKQYPYRTYAVALQIPAGTVPMALFWDTAEPYHYVRLQPVLEADGTRRHDLIITGGEDHHVGVGEDYEGRFDRLIRWTRERFPEAGEVAYRWSGQVFEPADGLGYIGADPNGQEQVFMASGDSGHGMTHGTIAGMLLPELIEGKEHHWKALYDPARKTLRAIGTFVKENLNVAAQYADWVTPGEVSSPEQIPPGEGAVVREGFKKVAIARRESGEYIRRSAVCTHLGGIVRWNSLEKSWDCPCHGARYNAEGCVITGPAPFDLKPAD